MLLAYTDFQFSAKNEKRMNRSPPAHIFRLMSKKQGDKSTENLSAKMNLFLAVAIVSLRKFWHPETAASYSSGFLA